MGTLCNNMIITIHPTQRQTPTRRKDYYSIMRAQTSINRLSPVLTVKFCIRQSPNNYLGYPRGRLSVVKHQQLARQVGTLCNNTILTINLMQRQMSTGCKVCYSITRAQTSINRLSLALTVEFCIRRSQNNCLGYPRSSLWMRERIPHHKTSFICQNGLPSAIPPRD
jgi:hypothetical protein